MTVVQYFPGSTRADIQELGGKAASLVRMAAAGLPVPPGGVLTTAFFEPWFAAVKSHAAWHEVVTAGPEGWSSACGAVKAFVAALQLDPGQSAAMAQLREHLNGELFAVRSSSPEEDLVSASFAGGYETRLGVTRAGLEDAVRICFASSLDARVLHYKHEHGFDPLSPSIAVVVQMQLRSEVAGVAFSINPINNDYDEVVIEASFGLGEAVVAGLTSPDHAVVRKSDGAVIEQRVGSKRHSIWLAPDGGTEKRTADPSTESCSSDAELAEIAEMTTRVEAHFERPIDIEWAYAEGTLYLLQARPVTAYVPLPPELLTEPGEHRRLYMDASLSNGLTLNVPVSPLGLDWLVEIFYRLLETFLGPLPRNSPVDEAMFYNAGGRLYANLSHMLWMQSPAQLERGNKGVDALMAAIMGSIDRSTYRSERRPPALRLRQVLRLPGMMWAARGLVWRLAKTLVAPRRALKRYTEDTEALEHTLGQASSPELRFADVLRDGFESLMNSAFAALWSALGAYGLGLACVAWVAKRVDTELGMRLQQGFGGNVVVEMGIALQKMAGMLSEEDWASLDDLAKRLDQRDLPQDFLTSWDAFLHEHGHRGPIEMDLASPRYADDPRLALTQMAAMARGGVDLEATHERLVAEREQTIATVLGKVGPVRRMVLRYANRLLGLFAGQRDTPKHLLTLYNYRLRQRALAEGCVLVAAGRIDAPEHIFDLHMDDLVAVRDDPSIDVRALRRSNIGFLEPLRQANVVFPPVIDSRGRILRPPPADEEPGELRGMGVSPGVGRGRVRLLRTPDARSIEPGEVLVAYTTDPGWTPLFVNAAAIVLEIGGTLQHGALVAREYGKPCVVGISQVLERLEDGQLVEVDGTAGVVRMIETSLPRSLALLGVGRSPALRS